MWSLKHLRKKNPKTAARAKRKVSIRKRLHGTPERPRLCVFRSAKHVYAQLVDDTSGRTLAAASSAEKEMRGQKLKKAEKAKAVGLLLAQRSKEKNLSEVVFDRNGFLYHGRVKAVAEGAREAGLKF